jgi:hypothetical protein
MSDFIFDIFLGSLIFCPYPVKIKRNGLGRFRETDYSSKISGKTEIEKPLKFQKDRMTSSELSHRDKILI